MSLIGKKAPPFDAIDQDGVRRRLSDYKGRKLVLYFYPKDMTPGCTREACHFRDNLPRFERLNAVVIGVSPDTGARHAKFAARDNLTFPLLPDVDHTIANAYDVWKEKSMYGRKYMGIERSTFLIDEAGKVARVWEKVKVNGHVEEVADAISG